MIADFRAALPAHREVPVLIAMQGLSYEEVARIYGPGLGRGGRMLTGRKRAAVLRLSSAASNRPPWRHRRASSCAATSRIRLAVKRERSTMPRKRPPSLTTGSQSVFSSSIRARASC